MSTLSTRLLTAIACFLLWCSSAYGQLQLSYLGTAGWEITDGKTFVLVDPYFSRLKVRIPYYDVSAEDPRQTVTEDSILHSDEPVIDAHVKHADFILITHTHSDHVMDTPYIARKMGAIVIGTESTTNFLRASGVPNSQLIPVKGGEDIDLGALSVRVVPSLHGTFRHAPNRQLGPNDFSPPRPTFFPADAKPPFQLANLRVEGGTLAYLVRLGSLQVLVFGSMNYIEREVDGLRPDVALIGALSDRLDNYRYTERLVRALRYPRFVLPTHWDRFNVPFDMSQQPAIDELRSFVAEVKAISPATKVIVPDYFKPIQISVLPGDRGKRR